MKYRTFGKLDWNVSALGFGAMRLPILEGDHSKIDEPEAIKMMRYAIDNGVNYLDTAYPYHMGNSEIVVGKTLQKGYREKVRLATKMPTWHINSQNDMDKYFSEQLDKLKTDHIDFYLLHGLESERWQKLKKLNVLKWAQKKIDEQKIHYLGFSFHDDYEVLKGIIDDYNGWTFCQIQYNYMDTAYQAGTKGLRYAASKGLAVVVMEPIAGGRLAMKPSKEIQNIWDKAVIKRSPAEWALQWVWNHPEVSVVLSGMSAMEHVIENVKSASRSSPGILTKEELKLIRQVSKKYSEQGYVGCTGCNYCMPCPEGVNIPEIIAFYNEFYMKNRDDSVKKRYKEEITPEAQAKKCVKCASCEEVCPQQIPVRKIVRAASWIFEGDE